jgi:hypothetical protein
MVYNTQDYWVFWTFPSSDLVSRIPDDVKVQKKRKSNPVESLASFTIMTRPCSILYIR